MRWLALLGMAFALVAAGCGGGDEESAPSDEKTIEEVLKEAKALPSGSDRDERHDFCMTLLTARVFISAGFIDPGSVSQGGLAELADAAPEEIRADIETLAQALANLTEEVGDDPDVFELEAALGSINPNTDAAEDHLDAWEKENCKRRG